MNDDDMKRAFHGRGAEGDLVPSTPRAKAPIEVSEQLYNECRGIMGTENQFQDMSLMNVIRHVIQRTRNE